MGTAARPDHPTPWHAVADWLAHHELPVLFGLPGDDLGPLHALEGTDIRMILCRDQRNAVFMAGGYALAAGRFAVCVVGKGPAFTNTMTGLLEARSGGVPLVLLAAGTGADRRGSGALQELDQLALARPLVSWAHRVDDPARLPAALDKAAAVATGPPAGVVYLEIPDHLLAQPVPHPLRWSAPPLLAPSTGDLGWEPVRRSSRPVLLVGGGMRGRNGDRVLERFAEQAGAAVFATASGRGAFDERHPAFCGLAGLYTPRPARPLWRAADLVISAGSRLEETATYQPGFADPGVTVVQLNLDAAGFRAELPGPKRRGDAPGVRAGWRARRGAEPGRERDGEWAAMIAVARSASAAAAEARLAAGAASGRPTVARVLADLDRLVGTGRILVQENGLQDMWSYFHPFWTCGPGSGSIVPSEQTSLGFGAAAAGGAALAAPGDQVVALVGDGAFTMVANDLPTLARERVPVLYVVLRNGGYGWLQHQLDDQLGRDGGASRFRFVHPGEPLPVPAHGDLHHREVHHAAELPAAVEDALAVCAKGAVAVLDIAVDLDDIADEIAELSDESAPELSP